MASKNEIKHRISLEGDEDVKRRLQAVGEAGKKSLDDIDKRLNSAKSVGAGGLEKSAKAVGEALAPLTEASGLSGLANLGGIGGLFGRFASGLTSPAGLVGAITSALLGMAKLGEETDRQKDRLKSLGDAGGFGKLSEQAKKLGTDVSGLQPRYEKFLTYQQKANSENRSVIHPPGFVSDGEESSVRVLGAGPTSTPPTREAFQAFDRALFEQVRRNIGNSDQAKDLTGQFEDNLLKNGLTSDSLRSLQQSAPDAASFVTNSLSRLLGRGFSNPNELAAQLDRGLTVGAPDVIREGAKAAPEADKAAHAAGGVTESFEALQAATKRLIETFGGDHANLAKGIGGAAGLVDQGAAAVDNFLHAADRQPGGKDFIGPIRPQDDLSKPPQSIGEVFSSDKGDLLGRLVGYLRGPAATGTATGPFEINGGNPLGVITDFLTRAFTNPGSIGQQQAPQPVSPAATAPVQSGPTIAAVTPQQDVGQAQQDSAAAASNVDDLGRAASDASSGLKNLSDALASASAAAGSSTSEQNSSVPVQSRAGGGPISGPGTSTSDSIPAMLSDKEYVIKASSAKKVGRGFLDWVNGGAPGYAEGGDAWAGLARFQRLANGGAPSIKDTSLSDLGNGDHSISATGDGGAYIDGTYYPPGSPILQDPVVAQEIAASLKGSRDNSSGKQGHHSLFTGSWGVAGFADGGAVGDVSPFAVSGGRIRFKGFADGGEAGMPSFSAGPLPQLSLPDIGGGFPGIGDLSLGNAAEALHPVTIDMGGGRTIEGLRAPPDVVQQLTRAARDSAGARTGKMPGWYYGQ